MIALWAVPMAALCGLARWWPNLAVRVLGVLTGVVVAATGSPPIPGHGARWRTSTAPCAIAVWVVAAAAAVLGMRQPRSAGVLLLFVGLAPLLIDGFRGGFGLSPPSPSRPSSPGRCS